MYNIIATHEMEGDRDWEIRNRREVRIQKMFVDKK